MNNIQLLDEAEQNIMIYQWRADQLFADAQGRARRFRCLLYEGELPG